ncbi:unnamed protein product, partial [Musa acuminata var. zebrina]
CLVPTLSSSSSPLFSCSVVTEPARASSGATVLMMPTTPPTAPSSPTSTSSSPPSPPPPPPPATPTTRKVSPRTKSTASRYAAATSPPPCARPASTPPSKTSSSRAPTAWHPPYATTTACFATPTRCSSPRWTPPSGTGRGTARTSRTSSSSTPRWGISWTVSPRKQVARPNCSRLDRQTSPASISCYGLVQCSRDLSADDCYRCLRDTVTFIPKCCSWKQGGKVYAQSCYLRFELYPYYNISSVNAPPPPSPSSMTANDTGPNDASGGKSNNAVKTVLLVVIPVAAALLFLLAIFVYCRRRKPARPRWMQLHKRVFEIKSAESLLLDLEVIKSATSNFSDANKLGEGGFGQVYRGTLEDGVQIAVKRLSRTSGQGLVELKNEVVLLAKLQHRNLVRLLGCCLQEEEKLLVYEYLPNTSLDKVLFADPVRRVQLDWARRYKIIEGIGRGLLYLHEDSRLKIVHRDLKASNILLDGDMNPKISDFGLAKLFDVDETQGNTSRIAGTYGYMAPEYALRGRFSTNSDVYSYGVLILEILTGRKNSGYQGSGNSIDLLSYVWRHWNQGDALQAVDQSVVDQCQPQEVLRCMHIGLLCVQEDPAQRPSMASITLMLNSYSVGLPTPSPPAFVTHSITEVSLQGRENSKGSMTSSAKESTNEVSISEMDPR